MAACTLETRYTLMLMQLPESENFSELDCRLRSTCWKRLMSEYTEKLSELRSLWRGKL